MSAIIALLVGSVSYSLTPPVQPRAAGIQAVSSSPRVMFICKANSCRSQIAHGILEAIAGEGAVAVESSGCIEASSVNPNAITVMNEMGIDISGYTSNALTEYDPAAGYDAVVSLCGCTGQVPDAWKAMNFVDWDLDDPPALDPGDLSVYRRVRDEIQERVEALSKQVQGA